MGRVVMVLDATPHERFMDTLRRHFARIFGPPRPPRPPRALPANAPTADPPTADAAAAAANAMDVPGLRRINAHAPTTAGPDAAALTRAHAVRDRLRTIRERRQRLVETGMALGSRKLGASPLVNETMALTRVAEEVSSGTMSMAEAAATLPRVPELAELAAGDLPGLFRLITARAQTLRTELRELNTSIAENRRLRRGGALPHPMDDTMPLEALGNSLDTVGAWPTDSSGATTMCQEGGHVRALIWRNSHRVRRPAAPTRSNPASGDALGGEW